MEQAIPFSSKVKRSLEARIVAVADTWDAMVGRRCYRQPMAVSDAIAELRRVKGTQLIRTS